MSRWKDQFKHYSPIIWAAVFAGGLITAAALARTPHRVATLAATSQATITASATVAPSAPTPTPAPEQPVVAGAATVAPVATTAPIRKPAATPAPAPAPDTVSLTLVSPAGTSTFAVRLNPGADACTVLEEAKAEGKIFQLNIDYTSYQQSLHSAYVRSINSYAEGWTVKVNGVAPRGCSLVRLNKNDNVTWRYE